MSHVQELVEFKREMEVLLVETGATMPPRELSTACGAPSSTLGDILTITGAGGLQASVLLVPDALGEGHLVFWHLESPDESRLNPDTFPGAVNPVNGRNATSVAYSLTSLCEKLRQGLSLAARGEAC